MPEPCRSRPILLGSREGYERTERKRAWEAPVTGRAGTTPPAPPLQGGENGDPPSQRRENGATKSGGKRSLCKTDFSTAHPCSPPDPGFTLSLLSIGGLGIHLQHPLARRLLAEAGLESPQPVAPGDQERHLLAGLETLHPPGPLVGMNPIIADGQDFVADVETRLESRRAAFDLVDHQAALLILGQQAQPCLGRLVRVLVLLIVLGEAKAQPVEGLGVIELLGGLQDLAEP